jgi:hypothetical protein
MVVSHGCIVIDVVISLSDVMHIREVKIGPDSENKNEAIPSAA